MHLQKSILTISFLFVMVICFSSSLVAAHENGNAEKILLGGKIIFSSKTNHEHIFTVIYSERIWACSVKTIGNWIGEGVGGAICHSDGINAETYETLKHLPHN